MTVAEIGCGRYLQPTDLRMLTRDGDRGWEYGIPFVGDEQEPVSVSPGIRLLPTRRQVSPGMVNSGRLDRGVHEHASVTLRMNLL